MNWQLQDAKNRFSEVVSKAMREGPQTVTLRGDRAAVVVSAEDYDRLTAAKPTLADHLLSGPAWDDAFVLDVNTRHASGPRDIDL
ncbi:MAG: type II toxin-antitoxin system Phd/YefM family antitoxin [Alphaproteobacteria bacterium]|nr:type II toxin-antitoxin system Phd/YefM family antitoxin [Alphaproteobacteria bacterium]